MVSAGGRDYCFFGIQGASPPLTVTGMAWFYRHPERQRRIPKPAVILSEAKDPVFCGFGVLFTGFFVAVLLRMTGKTGFFVAALLRMTGETGFFVAVLLRMTDIRDRAVGDACPCKADPKTGP